MRGVGSVRDEQRDYDRERLITNSYRPQARFSLWLRACRHLWVLLLHLLLGTGGGQLHSQRPSPVDSMPFRTGVGWGETLGGRGRGAGPGCPS